MKALNQLFTFLSGVITLTVFTFGVANAHNEYAMAAAKQPSVEAYTKAHVAGKVARTEAIARADAARVKPEKRIERLSTVKHYNLP